MVKKTAVERFYEKVKQDESGCLLWTGGRESEGYGWFHVERVRGKGRQQVAHRWLWEQLYGPVPSGKELHHTCEIKHCVNPLHLEVVTRKEHLGDKHTAYNTLKTHCSRGHLFTEENTRYYRKGGKLGRACRECQLLTHRRRYKEDSGIRGRSLLRHRVWWRHSIARFVRLRAAVARPHLFLLPFSS